MTKEWLTEVSNVGELVLLFRPRKTSKLHNERQGPSIITEKITDVTYKVDLVLERKIYRTLHINGLKPWISPEAAVFLSLENEFDGQSPLELEDKYPTNLTLSAAATHGVEGRLQRCFSGCAGQNRRGDL